MPICACHGEVSSPTPHIDVLVTDVAASKSCGTSVRELVPSKE
jgi:hypothetical protein